MNSAAPTEIEAAYMCYSLIISRESSSIMLLIWTLPPGERFPRLVPYSCSSPAPTEGCLLPLIVRWCRLLWRMLLSARGHIVTLLRQPQQGVRSVCRWWAGWYRCRGGASWDSQAAGVRTCLWYLSSVWSMFSLIAKISVLENENFWIISKSISLQITLYKSIASVSIHSYNKFVNQDFAVFDFLKLNDRPNGIWLCDDSRRWREQSNAAEMGAGIEKTTFG